MPPKTTTTTTDKVVLSVESQAVKALLDIRGELKEALEEMKAEVRKYKPKTEIKDDFRKALQTAIEHHDIANKALEDACELIGTHTWDV